MQTQWKLVWMFAAAPLAVAGTMPVAQQNELIRTYCAVCHTDAFRNGGLSLEHFDAGRPDPGVAAMLASKIKGKAMGAAGKPLPDRATEEALLSALTAEGAAAGQWFVSRTTNPASLTASIVRDSPSTASEGEPDLYRLTVTCRADTHEPEMQLAWSPGVPPQGQPLDATVDGSARFGYRVEGKEKMGNGGTITSGPGAIVLNATQHIPFPDRTLTISGLFPGGTVEFPFNELPEAARKPLAACFGK